MAIDYRVPWHEVKDEGRRAALQRQYELEVSKQHELWARNGKVVGQNAADDDVLVQLADGCFAMVHLTWASAPGDATQPTATLYSLDSNVSHAMAEFVEKT